MWSYSCGFVICLIIFGQVKSQLPSKCNIPSNAPKQIEEIINVCQDEIKFQILAEALAALQVTGTEEHRVKRSTFSEEDRRIAGCLLHCVYRKMKAVNDEGFPTTEGLVSLYSTGVTDKGYKLAIHQAVHTCLNKAQKKHLVSPQALEERGKTCDIAYEVFDCVADQVGEYCGQSP